MIDATTAHPPIVDRAAWTTAREGLPLEKAETHLRNAVAARRRRLPLTVIGNDVFAGAHGPVTLLDLFAGRSQLILHHFMFGPAWNEGCWSCSKTADNYMPHPAHFAEHGGFSEDDTHVALLVSAPGLQAGTVSTIQVAPTLRETAARAPKFHDEGNTTL